MLQSYKASGSLALLIAREDQVKAANKVWTIKTKVPTSGPSIIYLFFVFRNLYTIPIIKCIPPQGISFKSLNSRGLRNASSDYSRSSDIIIGIIRGTIRPSTLQ